MKARKFILFILSLVITLGLLPGCGIKAPPPSDGQIEEDKTPPPSDGQIEEDKTPPHSDGQTEEAVFRSSLADIASFAISPNAELFAVTMENGLARYSQDGGLLEEYPGTEQMRGLFYTNGFIYGYHASTHDILEFDVNNKKIRVVYAGLQAADIRSLAVSGGYIVLIAVPSYDSPQFEAESDGYRDLNEKLITIAIKDGDYAEAMGIRRPIALYQSGDGNLYVYARPDRQYVLFSLDLQNGKTGQAALLDDVGYTFMFAYEDGVFFYLSRIGNVSAKRMSDGFIYVAAGVSPLLTGGGFTRYGNLILFIEQRAPGLQDGGGQSHDNAPAAPITALRSIRLDRDLAFLLSTGEPGDISEPVDIRGNIIVSAFYYDMLFELEFLGDRSGVAAFYTEQPGLWPEYQEFLTSIMAGNDNIDIYILPLNNSISRAMLEQGYYAPLTGSAPIQAFFDKCFDWVRESAAAPGGDLWMLPLRYSTSALWYIPENFGRFNLAPSDVATFEGYYRSLERINLEKRGYATYAQYFEMHYPYWNWQYEMTYCDYPNGMADFGTALFSGIFDSLWTGWSRSGSSGGKPIQHPVMQYDYQKVLSWRIQGSEGRSPDYDAEHVIFKLDDINVMLENVGGDIAEWRVLPMPRISGGVEKDYMNCVYAVVNPHSKKKELAVAYLETAAGDMLSAINQPVFVLKDLSAYNGHYDMSLPVFRDLYDIYSNGAVINKCFLGYEDYQLLVDEYQDGKLTLEETLGEIQRRAEFWLHE